MQITNLTLLIIFSIFYIGGLSFLYFSKARLEYSENKIYGYLLILNLIGLVIQLGCSFVSINYDILPTIISNIVIRLMLVYLIVWVTLMFVYLLIISNSRKKLYTFSFISMLLFCFLVFVLPFDLYRNPSKAVYYSYGVAPKITFIYSTLISVFMFIILVFKRKDINTKKSIPIWFFLIIGIFMMAIQMANQSLVITVAVESLICCLMYFTIENPDAKMIEELNRNKMIIEKINQGNSNFLFTITTESRKYVTNVIDLCNETLNQGKEPLYKNALSKILYSSKVASSKLNNLIDISAVDVKNIKVINEQYNISKIFEEIKLQNQPKIKSDINFIINISPNLPEKLYGDKIRIKQVLSSLINNAINHTTSGFISMEVNTIIKYDTCRLIISVEDSGSGLSLEKVNDILSFNENISDVELSQIDTLDMDLKMIKKVMKMLGGSLLLTSEESKGTKVTIILDQKIVDSINTELEEKLTNYNELLDIQKVLIVDDDLNELNEIENYFNELGVETVGTMYGADAVDKVRVGQNFNLILLDDEMIPTNAINIFEDLKKYNVTSKIFVMLKNKKISLSKHYLKEGFTDFIDKSKLDVEIKRITKKYLK